MDYNTAAYATDTTLRFMFGGGVWTQDGSCLAAVADYFAYKSLAANAAATGANLYANSAFTVTTPSSNPTAGDSDVQITVLYSVINL